jgi:HlyD family secretion protein
LLKKLLLLLVPVLAAIGWLTVRRSAPPEVPFVAVPRETLVSTLTTNGKVEPTDWAAVHAEAMGPVSTVPVTRGQPVHQGQILATITVAGASAELSAAQSRISQAQAEIETLSSGGRAPELAEIESGIASAKAQLASAQREIATLERLVAKKAAPQAELVAARDAVRKAEMQIESLERRRSSLVTPPDRSAAQARLNEAQSTAAAAGRRIASGTVRAPMPGILYALEVRPGDYVQPGQPIARIGKLDRLRVILYVDEPELGRVARDMPVTITWDAQPGREWKGKVEALPLQVTPIGTRQVGEVVCIIENPDLSLLPGTNVNAEIRSRTVENALTLPKEALRRQGDETGVFLLQDGNKIVWRPVKVGAASVTRVEITSGLQVGDKVALPVDVPLKSGDVVQPERRTLRKPVGSPPETASLRSRLCNGGGGERGQARVVSAKLRRGRLCGIRTAESRRPPDPAPDERRALWRRASTGSGCPTAPAN